MNTQITLQILQETVGGIAATLVREMLEMLAKTAELAIQISEASAELVDAQKKISPLQDQLRRDKDSLSAAIAEEQSIQSAMYAAQIAQDKAEKEAAKKMKDAPPSATAQRKTQSVLTAGDADGRKKEMEAHLAKLARDPRTPIGEWTHTVRRMEMEVSAIASNIEQLERELKTYAYLKDLQIARMEGAGKLLESLTLRESALAAQRKIGTGAIINASNP